MECLAVSDLPEIKAGDDIAAMVENRIVLQPGDVVAVASTIVSKAEGRHAFLDEFDPSPRALEIAEHIGKIMGEPKDPRFAQAVLDESSDLLIDAPFLLTETNFGHVCVNAGIDRSNTGGADLLLLPKRPSESAAQIQQNLSTDAAVIVTDTCGRPFRLGQRGVAIGWAGIPANRDWRGTIDRDGHELTVTVEAVVDELAATANLVSGEGDGGIPVVVIRGFEFGEFEGTETLFRPAETDFIRHALKDWSYERD